MNKYNSTFNLENNCPVKDESAIFPDSNSIQLDCVKDEIPVQDVTVDNYNYNNITMDTLNVKIKTENDYKNNSMQHSTSVIKDEYCIKDENDSFPNTNFQNNHALFNKIEQLSPEGCDIFTENILEIKTENDYKNNSIQDSTSVIKDENNSFPNTNLQNNDPLFNKIEQLSPEGCDIFTENILEIKTENNYKNNSIQHSTSVIKDENDSFSNTNFQNNDALINKMEQLSPKGCDIFTENILENKTENDYKNNSIQHSTSVIKDENDSIPNTNLQNNDALLFNKIEQLSPEGCDIFTENILEIKTESDYKNNSIQHSTSVIKDENDSFPNTDLQNNDVLINKMEQLSPKGCDIFTENILENKTENDYKNNSIQHSTSVIKVENDSFPNTDLQNNDALFNKIEQLSPEGCDIFTENILEIKTEKDYKNNSIQHSTSVIKDENDSFPKTKFRNNDALFNKIEQLSPEGCDILTENILEIKTKNDLNPNNFETNVLKNDNKDVNNSNIVQLESNANSFTNIHGNRYNCSICQKFLAQLENLKRQMITHTCKKPRKCNICEKTFKLKRNIKRHTITHSGEKPFKCDVCKKSFTFKDLLKDHIINLHSGVKSHKCNICQKSFIRKGRLNDHMFTHTSEKPHKCDICTKSFALKYLLKNHKITHIGEKSHLCKFCRKPFLTKYELQIHMLTHSEENRYQCKICQKSFAYKGHFNTHMFTHTGEKPYSCKICQKSFTQKGNFNTHMFTHTDEKPYKCKICQKSFTRKIQLNNHMATHASENPL